MLKYLPLLAIYAVGAMADSPSVKLRHEGTPTGELKKVNGVDVYHAYAANKNNDNAILYLPDVFGVQLPPARLLADSYASANYLVLVPDYFRGDPLPEDMAGVNMTTWATRHNNSDLTSIIDATTKYARETLKVKRLGVAGFCYGGPFAVRELAKGAADAAFIAHPAEITDAELTAIKGPLTIAAAETDFSLNATRRHQIEGVLTQANKTYQINLYSGVSHGFAVRVNLADKKQLFGKESAFYQALRWFDEWVKGNSRTSFVNYAGYEEKATIDKDQRVEHDFEWSRSYEA